MVLFVNEMKLDNGKKNEIKKDFKIVGEKIKSRLKNGPLKQIFSNQLSVLIE